MAARVVSALVALPAVLALIGLGGWPFAALVMVASAICTFEFMGMALPGDRTAQVLLTVPGILLTVAAVTGLLASVAALSCASLLPIGVLTFYLFRIGDVRTVAARAGLGVIGVLWGGGLFTTACLRLLDDGMSWVLLACVLAWGSDTGAYFVGRAIGRHKLYEAVSPNKTWEGAIGGILVATVLAFGLRALLGAPKVGAVHLAILAVVGAALGQVGDLAESLLKRSVGAKDSGRIMPGHGGLFDRVDALIFTSAVVLFDAVLVGGETPSWLEM